jgi:NitT/TauT family transport system substrate-binding protein
MMIPAHRILLPLLLLFAMLGSCGCDATRAEPLRIAVNPWIGFTPLAYAQQKGWLDDCRIKLLWVVGLEESVKLYRQGLADGFAGTQYEYFAAGDTESLKPFLFFDRSYGADVILSNRTAEQLRQNGRIDVYLEATGVNSDLLKAFASQYGLRPETIIRHSSDPESMTTLRSAETPMLLIAYEPYATAVERQGFRRVASTRTLGGAMVIDALWLNAPKAASHDRSLSCFKAAVDRAVANLRADPEEFYSTISGYLKGQSFEAFRKSLEGIEWLNRERSPEVSAFLRGTAIDQRYLLP